MQHLALLRDGVLGDHVVHGDERGGDADAQAHPRDDHQGQNGVSTDALECDADVVEEHATTSYAGAGGLSGAELSTGLAPGCRSTT